MKRLKAPYAGNAIHWNYAYTSRELAATYVDKEERALKYLLSIKYRLDNDKYKLGFNLGFIDYFADNWLLLGRIRFDKPLSQMARIIEQISKALKDDFTNSLFVNHGIVDFLSGPHGLRIWCELVQKELAAVGPTDCTSQEMIERILFALVEIAEHGISPPDAFTRQFCAKVRELPEAWRDDIRANLCLPPRAAPVL
jgi:hypothetical protein